MIFVLVKLSHVYFLRKEHHTKILFLFEIYHICKVVNARNIQEITHRLMNQTCAIVVLVVGTTLLKGS